MIMPKRCFIAINLPEEIKSKLEKLIDELKKYYKTSIRGTEIENLHLTLHFLGDLAENQIQQVQQILDFKTKGFRQTQLLTDKIGAFPDLNQPRIIYLDCRQPNGYSLAKLQLGIAQALNKIGIQTDNRPWTPHLTLARVKQAIIFKPEKFTMPALQIPMISIELMSSQLNADGPEYKVISNFNLNSNT